MSWIEETQEILSCIFGVEFTYHSLDQVNDIGKFADLVSAQLLRHHIVLIRPGAYLGLHRVPSHQK
jgi:hypothetical protein